MLETSPPHSTTDPGPRHRRPSRGFRIGLTLLLVVGLLVALGVRYYIWCEGASGPRTPVAFTIEEGASGQEVVNALHDRGVLRCATVSRWLLARSGRADEVRAGTYELTTSMTPSEAFAVITRPPPPVPTVRLTIPEGYRLTQIADRVHEVIGIPAGRFMDAAGRGHWSLPPYLPKGKPLEGFLFPQTYEFLADGTTPGDVIDRLLQEFGTEVASLPWQNADRLGVRSYQVVTIASMIEREAALDRERPIIAGVIYNRLKIGMTLGIDATLLYDDPTPDGQLSFSDLEYDSPYNTYEYPGLPPGPIGNPGLDAILAALHPTETDYVYYLSDAEGITHYAKTFQEHKENKKLYLK